MESKLDITNKTRGRLPSLPLVLMKDNILGKSYSLSLAFVGEKKSKEINKKYRAKDKPTNILSFELSKNEGEIVICPAIVRREAKDKTRNRGKNFEKYLQFLVIHGMLHLKGMQHSSKMERAEEFYCSKYDQKYFNRNRHRNLNHESSGGRIRKGRKKS